MQSDFPNFSASFSLPYFTFQCFSRTIIIFSAIGKEKCDLSFFDMLLNFSVYLQNVFSVLYVLFETFQCFSEIFETGPNDYKNDSYYTVKVFTFTPLKQLPAF